jgi:hypothetical protein
MSNPCWEVHAEGGTSLTIRCSDTGAVKQQAYYVGKDRLWLPFGSELSPLLEDLVDLAVAVYVTDRLIRRRRLKEEGGLRQRNIRLAVPVAEPNRWNRHEVLERLSEVLGFLTEDIWEFSFYPRNATRGRKPFQHALFPPKAPTQAALFSGGLDSLAGLAIHLADKKAESMVAFTCATNPRLLRKQRMLLECLIKSSPTRLIPVILSLRLHQKSNEYNFNERSQRGRAFLYCIAGAVTSLMAGANELLVFENGVGAINLPISDAQLGVQSSRATHPLAIWKIERFLQSLLETHLHIRLPYLFSTKAQMCERFACTPFRSLAIQSVSCDGFPRRSLGPEQCGICTSCLLRRQALLVSDNEADRLKGLYRYDVVGNMKSIPVEKLAPWWDMLEQVDRIERAVTSRTPWEDLTIEYPELREILSIAMARGEPSGRQNLIELYKSYCAEWHKFPTYPEGWSFSASSLRLSA